MITYIKAPEGTASTTIQCSDIVRLEARVLEFFNQKVFNLYIFLRKGEDEHFHMLSYPDRESTQTAYRQLSASISGPIGPEHVIKLDAALPGVAEPTEAPPQT